MDTLLYFEVNFYVVTCIAVAISASIMRSVTTLNESRFKPQYFTINCRLSLTRKKPQEY